MARFARARAEMQRGNLRTAESLWTGLIGEGEISPTRTTTADRSGPARRTREGWPISRPRRIAPRKAVGPNGTPTSCTCRSSILRRPPGSNRPPGPGSAPRPFDYRAEEMTHARWSASPLPAGDVWGTLLTVREEGFRELGGAGSTACSSARSREWVLAFLAAGGAWAGLWKLLSGRSG